LGALLGGSLSDRRGRRLLLIIASLLLLISARFLPAAELDGD
jgi:MFS family permease